MIKKTALILALAFLISFTGKQQEKEATVKLPISKWVIVLKGVSELPLKESQDVYSTIVNQVQQQMQDTAIKKKP